MSAYQPSCPWPVYPTLLSCCVRHGRAFGPGRYVQHERRQEPEIYGSCVTSTFVDMFTDKEHYYVECFEETLTDVTAVGIMSEGGRLHVILSKGVQFHLDSHIRVMIRVDQDAADPPHCLPSGQG